MTINIYCCGPTVYAEPHIGNMRTFFFADSIRKGLEILGRKVKFAMNFTDIDDKIIDNAKIQNQPFIHFIDHRKQVTKKMFIHFGVLQTNDSNPSTTEYIGEILDMISQLDSKGLIYETEHSVLCSVDLSKYFILGQSGMNNRKILLDDKRKQEDFVLWKKTEDVFWSSPWGRGRPGWHIECAAMIKSVFNTDLDIQIGGEDLIFPHHENTTYLLNELDIKIKKNINIKPLLDENKKKMSKSSLDKYFDYKKVSPQVLRMFFLSTGYNAVQEFSLEAINNASKLINVLRTNSEKESESINDKLTLRYLELFNFQGVFGQILGKRTSINLSKKILYGLNLI